MAEFFPIRSSSPREPNKRPRPVPVKVRSAIRAMIYGAENDPAAKPLNVVEAAKAVGLTPFVLRRYFERPQVLSLLRAERHAFRELLSSTNEYSLATIRDTSPNHMARCAAIRQLETLATDEAGQVGAPTTPGVIIRVLVPQPAQPIDVTPKAPLIDEQ